MTALHRTPQSRQKQVTVDSSPKKRVRDLFLALTSPSSAPSGDSGSGSGGDLVGSVIFYNIVIVEAAKAQLGNKSAIDKSADSEHILCLSLTFLSDLLDLFRENLLELRAEVFESKDLQASAPRTLEFLKGPYLAQLIQVCLQMSQHRCVPAARLATSNMPCSTVIADISHRMRLFVGPRQWQRRP